MSLQLTGKLFETYEEQQVSDKFRKREFVLEVPDGSYTQYIKMQLCQDKCSLLDQYKTGQDITVDFNLKGRPFQKGGQTLYFTNVEAWRIESTGQGGERAPQATGSPFTANQDEPDELPF